MTVRWQKVEVQLEGLDEKTDRRSVAPGRLVRADNVVFERPGRLSKRRGYRAVPMADDVDGDEIAPSNLFQRVAEVGGELVLFGYDEAFALLARAGFDGAALVRRGPMPRGTMTVHHVSTAALSDPS